MGEVYRARDPRLGREVAIKVLPAALAADGDRLRRFEREARAVAALSHPNVLAIHDIGTSDATPYVVLELLAGKTLREHLSAAAMPARKAVDYASQIAHGLAAAHDRGIVHRDLKPENVFITTEGTVKLLDFGLATYGAALVLDKTDRATASILTEAGMVLGTVGYMSPEQVRGQTVDHRSDIFAFGAVVYEMLAGARAFRRDSNIETLNAILNSDPPPLVETRRNIPPALERIVHRCLEKSPGERFESARDIAFALETLSEPSISGRPVARLLRGRRRWLIGAAALVLVAALAVAWRVTRPQPATGIQGADIAAARRVVAVMPFKNISADASQNYFSAGMTEEIRGQLSKLAALRLLSRSAVERYSDKDVRRMAQELGAGSVVEGSVRLDKERVRIAVQLVDASSEQSLWSEQYDRALEDLLAVQSDVALRIADALQAKLSPEERQRVEKRPTDNVAAYQLYLKSLELTTNDREKNRQAIEMLRQAVAMDPRFALAQARMAYRTYFLAYYDDAKNLDVALEMAEEALRLDPTLAEAHTARASIYAQKGQVANARVAFLRAMELDPNAFGAMSNLSVLEAELGHYDESLLWAKRAFPLRPNSAVAYYHVGLPLVALGDDHASEYWLALASQRFPKASRTEILLAMLEYLRGEERQALARARTLVESAPKNEEAIALLAELTFLAGSEDAESLGERFFRSAPDITASYWMVPQSPRARYAYILARRGEKGRATQSVDEALKRAQEALKQGNQSPRVPMDLAAIHAVRGETETALSWLQRAYEAGWRDYRVLSRDPIFAGLREDRRFQALTARMQTDVAEMRRRANIPATLPVPPSAPARQEPTAR
jgi:TolB-like protein/Flp pilus assembly protein TadD